MYRYQPPKSNVWGHSLRNMKPARERALFGDFLARAVAEYAVGDGSLVIASLLSPELSGATVAHFENLLGQKAVNNSFSMLSPAQSQRCLDELVANEALYQQQYVILTQPFRIANWLIEGAPSSTESLISVNYGSAPLLSTWLDFSSKEEFSYVADVLASLKLCRLNAKYLKPARHVQ